MELPTPNRLLEDILNHLLRLMSKIEAASLIERGAAIVEAQCAKAKMGPTRRVLVI